MKPILIHIHVYYTSMWPELRDCVRNLTGYPFELHVTLLAEASGFSERITADFPEAQIHLVENRGYDIGPFLTVLEKVDLSHYSYVLKLHTKRDLAHPLQFRGFYGPHWRNRLLTLVRNRRRVKKCIEFFEKNPKAGMLSNCRLIVRDDVTDPVTAREVRRFLKERGFPLFPFSFVGGAMFFCRAALLQPIKDFHFQMSEFAVPTAAREHTLAHLVERLFGYFVYKQGYTIRDPFITPLMQLKVAIAYWLDEAFCSRWYKRKITKRGYLLIKIFNIPIYRKRLPPEERPET